LIGDLYSNFLRWAYVFPFYRFGSMADVKDGDTYQEELLDYEEEEEAAPDAITTKANGSKK
jgi:hypothetical protein